MLFSFVWEQNPSLHLLFEHKILAETHSIGDDYAIDVKLHVKAQFPFR